MCIFNAADKIRHAQDITLYGMDLTEAIPGFSDAEAKAVWLEDPIYQGTRKNVEGLMASRDWGEVIIGANLALEPLLGCAGARAVFLPLCSAQRGCGDPGHPGDGRKRLAAELEVDQRVRDSSPARSRAWPGQ